MKFDVYYENLCLVLKNLVKTSKSDPSSHPIQTNVSLSHNIPTFYYIGSHRYSVIAIPADPIRIYVIQYKAYYSLLGPEMVTN